MAEITETKFFISYAHKDEVYFELLKEGIESHSKSSQIIKWKIWCDKDIPIGSLWHEIIQNEIKDCNAAILLVSAKFLSSDYIRYEEFVNFLKRSEENDFFFFPILLDDCDIKQWDNLPNRQFFSPKGKDYDLPNSSDAIMPYSRLVRFSQIDGTILPNSYRETYHKNCVNAFENIITTRNNFINPNSNNYYSNVTINREEIKEKTSKALLKFISENIHSITSDSYFVHYFIDVDDLTKINQFYSNKVGCIVLQCIETIIDKWANEQHFPTSFIKVYGDQFSVFSIHDSEFSLKQLIKDSKYLREKIKKRKWHSIDEKFYVTISLGIIYFKFQPNDYESFQTIKNFSFDVEFVINDYFLSKLMEESISACELAKKMKRFRSCYIKELISYGNSGYNIPIPDMIILTEVKKRKTIWYYELS